MKNQYSFRLTTTLLPTDTSAKTTQVINKTDSSGNKFYPNFTEETVVLTNDDRTIIETTRATCNNGTLTFVKRGLSDDDSETQIANRKLTWNPGTLCFITAGASDYIDPDDDRTWQGDQTYLGKALYKGALETEKGVKYPHFDSLEDLQDYGTPFGGMFAVVDSDGELYRYNDVEEEWAVVTTSTPVQPAKASTTAIGTVRGATDAEFEAGTATGSQGELLVATPAQIQTVVPTMALHIETINELITVQGTSGESASKSYTAPKAGFISYRWSEHIYNGKTVNRIIISSPSGFETKGTYFDDDGSSHTVSTGSYLIYHEELLPVAEGETVTFTLSVNSGDFSPSTSGGSSAKILKFFYFG